MTRLTRRPTRHDSGHRARTSQLSVVRLALAVALALTVTLGLSSCSGGGGGDAKSAQEALAAAKKTMDNTEGLQLSLSTKALPKDVNGILGAKGIVTRAPAFDGTISVRMANTNFDDIAVISVDDRVYAQIPLTPGWSTINPEQYGAPDPAALISADTGFSSLLAQTESLKAGDSVRGGANNDEVLTSYTGTVPGAAMAAVIPSATGESFEATYSISDKDELRQADFTGQFYPGSDPMTYTVTFEDYGTTKDVVAPEVN